MERQTEIIVGKAHLTLPAVEEGSEDCQQLLEGLRLVKRKKMGVWWLVSLVVAFGLETLLALGVLGYIYVDGGWEHFKEFFGGLLPIACLSGVIVYLSIRILVERKIVISLSKRWCLLIAEKHEKWQLTFIKKM